jgi:hypothetical protein
MPTTKPDADPPAPSDKAARDQPTADDRPQREDEYLSKFLQNPSAENERKDGNEAEAVNKSPKDKPGKDK